MKPRVAVLHPWLTEPGGAEFVAVQQARIMRGLDLQPRMISLGYDGHVWDRSLGAIPVDLVPRALGRLSPAVSERISGCALSVAHNFPMSAALGGLSAGGVRAWYCHEPPRHLHVASANPHLARAAAGVRNLRSEAIRDYLRRLVLPWGLSKLRLNSRVRQTAWDLRSVQGLDFIWANSAYTRENIRRTYGRGDAEVLYPPVRFARPARNRSGLRRSGLQVLTMSRLSPAKNIETVVRGFAAFRRQSASGATLHVVGHGTRRPYLESVARLLDLGEDAIRFHGWLDSEELARVRQACDVFALLPADEPFGMVFPEAASSGLLVVGPDHGGPVEILDGGALGELVDAFSPHALAEALGRIWRMSDADVDRRREACDSACRDRYDAQIIAKKFEAHLSRLGIVGA